MNGLRFAPGIIAATCALCLPAFGVVTFYSSRASWEAATSNQLIVTTFDEPVWPVNSVLTGDWAVGGVTYRGLAGTPSPNVWIMAAADSPLTKQSMTANGDEDIDLIFNAPRRAMAMDIAVNHFGPVTVTIYDAANAELGSTQVAASTIGTLGVVASSRIARVNFRSILGAVENSYLDNVTIGFTTCPADFNLDGLVDDSDFVIFVNAYNILDCADPSMPAGCPADLNADGFVDDTDFVLFVAAYNDLVCP